jgi:ectoine hydroxylase-related dioxygenase (phytanoyl-CoA dioxygenase family)
VLRELLNGDFRDEALQVPRLEPGDICVFSDSLVHGAAPWDAPYTRRSLYFMYSPGYMAWRPYSEIAPLAALARTDLQRSLLRPPYVAGYSEEDGALGDNHWRASVQ